MKAERKKQKKRINFNFNMKSSILPLFLFRLSYSLLSFHLLKPNTPLQYIFCPNGIAEKGEEKRKKKGKQTNKPRASGNPKRFIFVCDAQIHSLVSSTIAGNGKPLPMSIN